MKTLISGSLAYDYIMDFPDSFKNHILPDQVHILNVSFTVDTLNKNFGGNSANIAYTMKLLGGNPLILAPIGKDADEYMQHFDKFDIETKYIRKSKNKYTSSAHITTDKDDNQITAFYPGAGTEATDLHVSDVEEEIELAIITTASKEAIIQHAKECHEKNIPLVFDPGQQIISLSDQELMMLIGQAKFFIVNDYELKITEKKTGWSKEELLDHVEVLIITFGEKGSVIITKDQEFEIKPCPPNSIEDPTGAGDAYRSGFFSAHTRGLDYQTCGQVGSVAATYAIEHYGTQNHHFTVEEFSERYKDTYGEAIDLKM